MVTDLVAMFSQHLITGHAIALFVGTIHRNNIEVTINDHERAIVCIDQRLEIEGSLRFHSLHPHA